MINLLDIRTPAQAQALALKSDYGLDNIGLYNVGQVVLEPADRGAVRRNHVPS